ncbi:hypothetical protein [Pontibacter fetidus]|uniref:Uncharacterized protein n=1 Tax=Pontibacter fetidus TaxID=2700082 RepID=A0A6B2H948_9BACT|nr:hypothetical protein [Pontibacter fetidus]NDK57207.1 hypothetical protein [Pontibacter fetidus]
MLVPRHAFGTGTSRGAQPKDCDLSAIDRLAIVELARFEIDRGYSFVGTGRDLSAHGL